ncbi:dTDP-4-dehydrorhamnose reductase [Nitrosopumilus sp.]|nr:dTDP-4-dehydrorhamnose reductase [Nitrosopumilus sp.]
MKFLVTGSAGLIGNQLVHDLEKSGEQVYSCYNSAKPFFGIPIHLNLFDLEGIHKIFKKIQPDIIIHSAALTDVEKCEVEPKLANLLNIKATEVIAQEVEKINSYLMYISTDYVFDGKQGLYKETDLTNPLNNYGLTKLSGEKIIQEKTSRWSIIRTSTPFGEHPSKKTFPSWVYENLKINKKINVVENQLTSPTYVPNLSKMILEIITRNLEGFFHLAGSTRISRFEFAKLFAKKLNLDFSMLNPVKIDTMLWNATRPLDSSLDMSKINSILTTKPFTIEKSLDDYASQI